MGKNPDPSRQQIPSTQVISDCSLETSRILSGHIILDPSRFIAKPLKKHQQYFPVTQAQILNGAGIFTLHLVRFYGFHVGTYTNPH